MKRLPQMMRANKSGQQAPTGWKAVNRVVGKVTQGVATIRLDDVIDDWGGWWGISSKEISALLDELPDDVTQINLLVNSPGGIAHEGVAIANEFRNHPARVTAYVTGLAASAASYVAVGADETIMCPGSQLMIHDAANIMWGQEADFLHEAGVLGKLSQNIAGLYATAAGGTADEWRALMRVETWYTAQEAVDAGLAQSVGSISVPDGGEDVTADEDAPVGGSSITDRWDLSLFTYAGRNQAPAPTPRQQASHTPPAASAGGSTITPEGATLVDLSNEQIATLREQVGFPEDADASTIVGAIVEALGENAETTEQATNQLQIPEGMTLIERDVLTNLQTGAQAGVEARNQQRTEARDNAINAAINDGRITPGRRDHWVTQWNADAEGTSALLNTLPKGFAVPLEEIGHGGGSEATKPDNIADVRQEPAYTNWSL